MEEQKWQAVVCLQDLEIGHDTISVSVYLILEELEDEQASL